MEPSKNVAFRWERISHKTHLQSTATSVSMYLVSFNSLKQPRQRHFRGGSRDFKVKHVLQVKQRKVAI